MNVLIRHKNNIILLILLLIIIIIISMPKAHKEYDFTAMIESVKKEAFKGKHESIYPVFAYYIENNKYNDCNEFYSVLVIHGYKEEAFRALTKATSQRGLENSICGVKNNKHNE